jgi:DNA-binding MurR/RpiR family transcriptional regulator
MARNAAVSIATVTRFAKAVGCADVRELKLRLAQAAAVGQRFLSKNESDGLNGFNESNADGDSLVSRIFDDIHLTLALNRGALEAAPIASAAAALAGASMIYVFGLGGGSTALADEMRFRLVRLGRPVASYQDGLLQRMVAATLDAGHVVVALSVSGFTPDMLESCRIARDYGARIIAFTAPASPLAQLADWLIPVIANESDFIYKPSSSRYAMLMALDLLVTELAVKQADTSRELLRRMKLALDAHRGGGERQLLGD